MDLGELNWPEFVVFWQLLDCFYYIFIDNFIANFVTVGCLYSINYLTIMMQCISTW